MTPEHAQPLVLLPLIAMWGCAQTPEWPPDVEPGAKVTLHGEIDLGFALTANVLYMATRSDWGCGSWPSLGARIAGGGWAPNFYWRKIVHSSKDRISRQYQFDVPIGDYDPTDTCRYRPHNIGINVSDTTSGLSTSKFLGSAQPPPLDPQALQEFERRPRALRWTCLVSGVETKVLRCEPASLSDADSTKFTYEDQAIRFDVLRKRQ